MAIKPVTYQGVGNFDAHLYALEVASRFIDQNNAHGYYKNYGEEISGSVFDNNIIVGTGAFLVCGRMNEITARETVPVTITNNNVGYVVARVETYHPSDQNNCRLLAYTAASLSDIALMQENITTLESKSVNKVYELPLFSFEIRNGSITNIKKLISAVADYATVKQIVDDALQTAENAVASAENANTTANAAVETSNAASAKADEAVEDVNAAVQDIAEYKAQIDQQAADATEAAENAVATANKAAQDVADYSEQTDADIAEYKAQIEQSLDDRNAEMSGQIRELERQIGEKQGTTVKNNGTPMNEYEVENVVNSGDVINLSGGGV